MELHGTEASLSVDRMSGDVMLARPEENPELVETISDQELGNRFAQFAFPGVRERIADVSSDHPGLDDGWRVQVFIDAAKLSAQRGAWVELAELNADGS